MQAKEACYQKGFELYVTSGYRSTLWQKEIYPYTVLSGHSRLIHCLNPEDNTPKQCLLESPAWPGVYQVKIESGSESLTQQFFVFPYILSISILLIFSVFYLLLKKQQNPQT